MLLVWTVTLFLLGLAIGSFLNVLIDRIPKNLSIGGRSYCDYCKKSLGILDLIPLFSFINLGGRCRYCKKPISFRNPIVELTTGILFVLTFIYVSSASPVAYIELIYNLFIVASLIAILFIDLKHQIIPDKVTYPAIAVSFLYLMINNHLLLNHLLSSLGASLFFLLLFLGTSGRGLGFGDIKLSFLMGVFLGFPKIIVALYTAFLTGAIVSVILILWEKKRLKDKIPFGPFLITGTLIAYFLSDKLVSLWLNFL